MGGIASFLLVVTMITYAFIILLSIFNEEEHYVDYTQRKMSETYLDDIQFKDFQIVEILEVLLDGIQNVRCENVQIEIWYESNDDKDYGMNLIGEFFANDSRQNNPRANTTKC